MTGVRDAARAIAPLAAEHAGAGERDRRLAEPVVEALRAAGMFRLLVPAAYGGGEVSPADFIACVEEIAHGDGAAAWCVAVAATSGMLAAYIPADHAQEVYGDPRGCAGGVFAPKGLAVAAGDTLTITGRWPFTSGVDHCDWLMGGCFVEESGERRTVASGAPEIRLVIFPASAAEVIDTWDVAGLRGTGSHDTAVEALAVPAARSASLISDAPLAAGPLYAFPVFGLLALAIAGVGLGIARAAVDDLVELAGGKTPALSSKTLAARPDTQARVAKAAAGLGAARALVAEEVGAAWDEARTAGSVAVARRAALRAAATHAMATAASVTGEMYALGGGSSIYSSSPLQRRFRDVNVATQHMLVGPATWELAGRVLLGVPGDTSQL